jgi:L-rhamnose-H+ transport protein
LEANPFLGVLFHWIGGLAAASFYIPYLKVRRWAWETYWLVGGFFAWILAPWVMGIIFVPNTIDVLRHSPESSILWSLFFGLVWGVGGITYGLTMRYLGIALGTAVALGCCAAFGTLVPPMFDHTFLGMLHNFAGQVTLFGVLVCLAGITISGFAGMSKERELTDEQKKASVGEFRFGRGIVVAVICGFTSAAMAYGFAAGKPIAALAAQSLTADGRSISYQNMPVLIVILIGGFATNLIWCAYQNVKNRTIGDYLGTRQMEDTVIGEAFTGHGGPLDDGPATAAQTPASKSATSRAPLLANYLFCLVGGVTWYLQFFFYGIGTTKMGKYDFSSWTLHMSSIIIFGTLWGIALKEWKGTSRWTHKLIAAGLFVLIASTLIVGYGNFLASDHH